MPAKALDPAMGHSHHQPLLALGLAGALFLTEQASACSIQAPTQPPVEVAFCELVKTPEKYSGKYIATSGIYQSNFEVVTFYSPDCSTADAIWAEIPDPKLRAAYDRNGTSFSATVIGRFRHAPDTLVKTEGGSFLAPAFGFLGQFRNLIEIDCFQSVPSINPPP